VKNLAEFLEGEIRTRFVEALAQAENDELRRIFNGPCMTLLEPVFAQIEAAGGIRVRLSSGAEDLVPVLLQVQQLEGGAHNPPLSQCGRCDPDHFMTLRNNRERFVVLLSPGARPNLSFSSASDEFGMSAAANSGNARVEDWLADPFVRLVRDEVMGRLGLDHGATRQEFIEVFERVVRDADELEHHSVRRQGAWALLARLMDIAPSDPDRTRLASLVCGLPPTTDGRIDSVFQSEVLDRLASAFSESGFRTTFQRLLEGADDEDQRALQACLEHIESSCSLPSEFDQAPTKFFRPCADWELQPPPAWWTHLTAERWHDLLHDDDAPVGEAAISCCNSIVQSIRGLDGLVLDQVQLSISLPEGAALPSSAALARISAGREGARSWGLSIGGPTAVTDDAIPRHKSAMRYVLEVPGLRKATARIISLAQWEPGILIDARTARKSKQPRAVRGRAETYEASLVLDGVGRHDVDVFVRPGVTLDPVALFKDSEGAPSPEQNVPVLQVSETQFGFDIEAVPLGEVLKESNELVAR